MSPSEPPQSEPESNVTSLASRLPPAQRAKLLARVALAPHVSDRAQLAQLGEYATRIEGVDLDAALADLDGATSDLEVVRETRTALRAARGLRSFCDRRLHPLDRARRRRPRGVDRAGARPLARSDRHRRALHPSDRDPSPRRQRPSRALTS